MNFSKYEGAGNDFIVVDDRPLALSLSAAQIARLCDRRFGVGADGLLLLQTDPRADFRLRIYNADGSEASGCGNGTRCLLRFLLDLGLPAVSRTLAVGDRLLCGHYLPDAIAVEMGPPTDLYALTLEGRLFHHIDTGVPHLVHFTDELSLLPLLGPRCRPHPAPRGANVSLAALRPDGIHVRTYERGVEGETLACGTGATAVAVLAHHLYSLPSPVPIHYPGGTLTIHLGHPLLMAGPAQKVFEGKIIAP